ncbi:hypothetical protein B0H10DRAFT_2238159 [Mycena sp. CBHHK59/15]|nr:hypothetical protein B0H10DRAFT_2242729 [Mycena sp. CBHHK59/15]KAJ6569906.1 hypothetical protein B0H10DRAFT_2238159 [Mycena sp. CBHHK59/15]
MLPPIGIRNPATRKQPTVLCFQTTSRLASTATKEPTCSTAFGADKNTPTPVECANRHAKGCDAISEQKVPEDVDQPAPGATPLANPARLSRKDSFDPAASQSVSFIPPTVHSLPLQPNSLCQWEAGMTV